MARLRQRLVTKQPVKAMWTAGAVINTTALLPFWLIYFIPSYLRQHPKWTYKQAILNKLLRTIMYHSSKVEFCTTIQLDENHGFFKINPPTDLRIYTGLLQDPGIQPTTTGGCWFPTPYNAGAEVQTVVLHFHGGAYVSGQGRANDNIHVGAGMLAKYLKAKVLCPSYRLASNENGGFPAALQDAITVYRHLLDQGIPPQRITLSGDSAGANLVVALLRHIANSAEANLLPNPSAALLWSPWLDLKSALDEANINKDSRYKTDFITANFLSWGARVYIPSHMDPGGPYFTPADHPFETKTPLWIHLGGLELLHGEAMRFAEGMREIRRNKVDLYVEPFAPHDILSVGNLIGFSAEATRGVKLAGEFLVSNCKD